MESPARSPRALVVIARSYYVRNVVAAGVLDELSEVTYVAPATGVAAPDVRDALEATGRPVRTVAESRFRRKRYANLQLILLSALRRRSRTMAMKVAAMPRLQRWRFAALALPGVRRIAVAAQLAAAGRNRTLERVLDEVGPDLVIAPSGGIDALVGDAVRAARRAGVPSLVIAHNWDNLSSKGAFPIKPDHLAVWGAQSVEHAGRIHGFDPARVHALGAPALDHYFRHRPGSTASPFPSDYVLFAGCYAPFDERDALRRIDEAIEATGSRLTVVYRPHPHRRPRRRSDRVEERDFAHVLLDPEVREQYHASLAEQSSGGPRIEPVFPPLERYPALLEHARAVVCPLSTMIVEAAIFARPVLVVAYDDGVHPDAPATMLACEHFAGVPEAFAVCRHAEDLGADLMGLLARGAGRRPAQLDWWLHHDERTYAARLRELAAAIVAP